MTGMQIADKWFERKNLAEDVIHLWEPHVHPLLRCNVWFVRGGDKDMLIDTGMGLGSLKDEIQDLSDKPVAAVATHIHFDHVGCLHEFDERIMHMAEAPRMANYDEITIVRISDFPEEILPDDPEAAAAFGEGFDMVGDFLVNAVHKEGFDLADYKIQSTLPTREIDEGDEIEIGGRVFEVLHLPGHSPGSIGLWEAATGVLFSGDAIYDGSLVDVLPDSDIVAYIKTMKRLRELPVDIVHGGHMESFGRERLIELCDAYLAARDS
jgi:glyoxylase-like metal-dependent hydrolase (beta-lactamase superfamily II)